MNTWPLNPANGAPTNVSYNSSTGLLYGRAADGRLSVHCSTRAGEKSSAPINTDAAFHLPDPLIVSPAPDPIAAMLCSNSSWFSPELLSVSVFACASRATSARRQP